MASEDYGETVTLVRPWADEDMSFAEAICLVVDGPTAAYLTSFTIARRQRSIRSLDEARAIYRHPDFPKPRTRDS